MKVVSQTEIKGAKLFKRGKVRDIYEADGKLLMVATDRISAFDVVLPNPIPYKGIVLTQMSIFWFEFLSDIVKNHFITSDVNNYPDIFKENRDQLEFRSMLVLKTEPLPIECVVRGYISGSAWRDYLKTGSICGIKLPAGLKESDKLSEPIFTPATKAVTGHDENITFQKMKDIVGGEVAKRLRDLSIKIYLKAESYARERGIIIADTKFEFGVDKSGDIILIDEVLTPDSSRFWPVESYSPGTSQPSFDKQFVRDYLESIGWDKTPPAPELPDDVVRKTTQKYIEAYKLLTGKELPV